jgi:hypothetical protein
MESEPVRILLVEDDEIDRMAVQRLFANQSLPSSQKTRTKRLIFGNLNFWQLSRSNLGRAGAERSPAQVAGDAP